MIEEPPRWLEDPEAPPDLREDMRATSDAPPPELDYAAGLAALGPKVRAGGGAGGAGSSLPGVAIGIAIVLAIGGAGWLGLSTGPREVASAPEVPPPDEAPRVEDDPAPPAAAETEPDPRVDPGASIEVAPPEPESESAEREPQARESPRRSASRETPPDPLRREMELLEQARRALDADPARCLVILDTARREVGVGTFSDERDAIRVLALFALGRDAEARRIATRLLARDPHGLYADRVRRVISERAAP